MPPVSDYACVDEELSELPELRYKDYELSEKLLNLTDNDTIDKVLASVVKIIYGGAEQLESITLGEIAYKWFSKEDRDILLEDKEEAELNAYWDKQDEIKRYVYASRFD